MRSSVWVLVAAGCSSGPALYRPDCEVEEVVLAPDEVSPLGFSPEDAVGWYGASDTVEVTWTGRHSRTPASDVFELALGPLTGDARWVSNVPARADVDPSRCSLFDRVELVREARIATADGGVTGEGTATFSLLRLDLAGTRIVASAADVTLDDARWREVDLALDADLAPPEQMSVVVYRDGYEGAGIVAEGPNYSVSVWKCDENRTSDCLDWRSTSLP
jgi:hypothetical protein